MNPVILVVEDDENDFFLLRRAFSKVGVDVDFNWFNDGSEAAEHLLEEKPAATAPSLIICDLKMPRMGGIEFLQLVKANETLSRVPFVVLTSSSLEADRREAQRHGADLYLVKPGSFGDLLEVARLVNSLARGRHSKRTQSRMTAPVPKLKSLFREVVNHSASRIEKAFAFEASGRWIQFSRADELPALPNF